MLPLQRLRKDVVFVVVEEYLSLRCRNELNAPLFPVVIEIKRAYLLFAVSLS